MTRHIEIDILAFNLAMPLVLMNGDIDTILKITQKGIEFLYEKFKEMIKYNY